MIKKKAASGVLASVMIAGSIATATPAQAAPVPAPAPSGCSTGIDAGTKGSYVRARCLYGKGWYWVKASCLRPDGSGLRHTVTGDTQAVGGGLIWSTYYPCRYPRNVSVQTLSFDS
ncbi:hypothetical protein SAMN05216266_10266 [Amycolatopsis marina]|uniref:Uncharacterized protein n=1 Tax=Amycolatopsis marina TaxID=490629 RepID=A0A1I0WLR6_9PSEU|nr:hypothetical protein [Amycolatopsis marina]SFA89692.1 hypothetical protein SAMN05216266_10266 [Amycolatopsis marina]